MGFYQDKQRNLNIYDAPKSAGTTIRAWILYDRFGDTMLDNTPYNKPKEKTYAHTKDIKCDWFKVLPGDSMCIKRDPVKRFISCYKDKILREGRCNSIEVDKLINNFDKIMSENKRDKAFGGKLPYLWYHFAPQWKQFGEDPEYYHKVFDISQVSTDVKSFLEDRWDKELPDLHTRKSQNKTFTLTDEQVSKIKNIYKRDYELGWC